VATVSANTLFHFTNNIDNLIGILTNNFYPRFCLENHSAFFLNTNYRDPELAIPMVCFCDIPLSNISNHVDKYGRYAIGLSKNWGIINNISPLTYFHDNSVFVKIIKGLVELSYQQANSLGSHDYAGIYNKLYQLIGFTKKYIGISNINGKIQNNICFYNEREWRYCPDTSYLFETGLPYIMEKQDFYNEKLRIKSNNKLENQDVSLKFTPSDIKYIILSKENEIHAMINNIESIKSVKYSSSEIELLKTRIISMEQVSQDF